MTSVLVRHRFTSQRAAFKMGSLQGSMAVLVTLRRQQVRVQIGVYSCSLVISYCLIYLALDFFDPTPPLAHSLHARIS